RDLHKRRRATGVQGFIELPVERSAAEHKHREPYRSQDYDLRDQPHACWPNGFAASHRSMAHALNPEMAPNVASAIAHGRRLLSDAPALAAQQAREILSSSPRNAEAYRLLGAALRLTGDEEGANEAELAAVAEAKRDPELMRAGAALAENDLPTAEAILR